MTNLVSKNEITGENYTIPDLLDNSHEINNFLELNAEKPVVVVQGLGFVGAVMSLVCANALNKEYAVLGIDLPSEDSYWKIKSINEGTFPIVSSDKKVDEFFQNTRRNKNLFATYDPYAYSKADIIIVDINLDVKKELNHITSDSLVDYSVDLSGFKSAIRSIGNNCKEDVLILIETTVPPGTTIIAKEIIEECIEERGLEKSKIKIGHSYERVMPGPNYIDSIQNFYRVYSGVNDYSANHVELFLKTIIKIDEYPLTRLKNTNSTEMSKVLENSFRAMNIAFIVEWSRYAEEAGVDLYEVVNAIRMRPTHKNIMLPGIGVGGYCLTKDPLLASWSKKNIFKAEHPLKMSESAVTINDRMPLFAYEFLQKHFLESTLNDKEIYFLGVSYAPDVGDTRYSPVELLCRLLMTNSSKIYLHDIYVPYWKELELEVSDNFGDLNNNIDIVIISTGHTLYKNNKDLIKQLMRLDNIFIFDTIGILNEIEINELSSKHIVKVLGRGDI